jgi:hypothetical protein
MWSSADIIGVLRYVRFVPEPEVWCVDLRCGGGEGPKRGHKDPRKTALMKSR